MGFHSIRMSLVFEESKKDINNDDTKLPHSPSDKTFNSQCCLYITFILLFHVDIHIHGLEFYFVLSNYFLTFLLLINCRIDLIKFSRDAECPIDFNN